MPMAVERARFDICVDDEDEPGKGRKLQIV
jgi:hypothetical protein